MTMRKEHTPTFVMVNGEPTRIRTAARILGVSYNMLYSRVVVRGMTLEEALAKPVPDRRKYARRHYEPENNPWVVAQRKKELANSLRKCK